MILTITLNPSVDISYKLDSFSLDTVNRVNDVSKTAGGKGLNVARVVHQLEEEVGASGFLGGNLGDYIRTEITTLGIRDLFLNIQDETRNCIAVIHEGKQTEILESGPTISSSEADLFLEEISNHVQQAKVITISGSLPKGLEDKFYKKILEIANRHKTPVLLDTKGELLSVTLESESKPYLIKPNQDELTDLVGRNLDSEAAIIDVLRSFRFEYIPWVVVTLGADGAIVKHGNNIYRAIPPKVNAVNPVGSGDSVIAGFATGISRELTDVDLIKFGLSMGILNAMEEKTGYIDATKITWCVREMQVNQIF
ncbi:hexose kinase [Aquibacillus saliphilus]|uniref:hexose kinase n=1 Tax=Aquibacillus saliphilus TaxID=1909422 RepID=UPI001CF06DF8|nr:hexose kinase [Aquibacillus saliphilus]